MTKPMKRTSEFYSVGQSVYCRNPEGFVSPVDSFLKDRVGTVESVAPAVRPNNQFAGHVNVVWVLWHRRGGRGKEKKMMMGPGEIEVVSAS